MFTRIRRTPYQSLLAVATTTLSLFVATIYFLSALSAQQMLLSLESRPQAIAFIKDQTGVEEVEKLKSEIFQKVTVKEVRYLSKEDALKKYQEQNNSDPLLLELVTANILPASLEISAKSAADLPVVAQVMKGSSIVSDVAFQQEETKGLVSWINSIRFSGSILVGALLVQSIFVLLIIFGLKIALKKEEIGITRLVGGSKWQIRRPFLQEGIFYGAVAGIGSFLASYYFIVVLGINPLGTIPALTSYSLPFEIGWQGLSLWAAAEIGIGAMLGLTGSFLSVWRYLKN
jgi:cell division transport system permease protein